MSRSIDTGVEFTESPSSEPATPSFTKVDLKKAPRAGGIEDFDGKLQAWTGGGMLREYKLASPSSNGTRPSDPRAAKQTMFECMKPLPESKHIDSSINVRTGGTTFISWMNAVERKMVFDGTDTIAYVLKLKKGITVFPDLNDPALADKVNEYCLFTDWGKISSDDVKAYVAAQVRYGCPYDKSNNEWATAFLRGSIGPNLLTRADFDLPKRATGTEYLHFILSKVQASSGTARFQLMDQLRVMKLSQFQGHHVIECVQRITEIMTTLEGYGIGLDSEIPFIVIRIFSCSPTGVVQFDTEVNDIEKSLDKGIGDWPWDKIVHELQIVFDRLLMTDRWPLLAVPSPAAASGFVVTVDPNKTKGDPSKLTGRKKNGGLSSVVCHECGKKGHIRPKCPNLAKTRDGSTEQKGRRKPADGAGHPSKIPPKAGEPHTKTIQLQGRDVTVKYCEKCALWRSGKKSHLTAEHTDSDATAPVVSHTLRTEGAPESGTPFGSLFTGEITQSTHDYFADLYDRHTVETDDASGLSSDACDQGWEQVLPGKGTPVFHATVDPKDLAGRV